MQWLPIARKSSFRMFFSAATLVLFCWYKKYLRVFKRFSWLMILTYLNFKQHTMALWVSHPQHNLTEKWKRKSSQFRKVTPLAYFCIQITLFTELIWFQRITWILPDRKEQNPSYRPIISWPRTLSTNIIVYGPSARHIFRSSCPPFSRDWSFYLVFFCFGCEV